MKVVRIDRVPAVYAALSGVILGGWWVATLADILPAALLPVQRQGSHVVAELVLAAALIAAAWLDARGRVSGRVLVPAALGALLYATVNVFGDYTDSPSMIALLSVSAALTLATLAIAALRWR